MLDIACTRQFALNFQSRGTNSASIQREVYLKAASGFFDRASAQAEAGDFQAAGSLILKALDQERRAGVVGPQVLQLIKPRS